MLIGSLIRIDMNSISISYSFQFVPKSRCIHRYNWKYNMDWVLMDLVYFNKPANKAANECQIQMRQGLHGGGESQIHKTESQFLLLILSVTNYQRNPQWNIYICVCVVPGEFYDIKSTEAVLLRRVNCCYWQECKVHALDMKSVPLE